MQYAQAPDRLEFVLWLLLYWVLYDYNTYCISKLKQEKQINVHYREGEYIIIVVLLLLFASTIERKMDTGS